MRSIKANYKNIQIHNLNLGTYPCLAKAIKGKSFSRKSLVKAFNELMPENEYDKSETKGLVDYLEYLTNVSVEGEFIVKNDSEMKLKCLLMNCVLMLKIY